MGGKIANPAAVVRPWNEGWQLWKRARGGGTWACLPAATLADLPQTAGAICAVPARMVLSACFWVEATEPEIVEEMAGLEIEVRGLGGRERMNSDAAIRILLREKTRTLVRAVVFPSDWPEELAGLPGRQYEPSPGLAVLADQSVHLWREGDDLVAAVTWRGQLVCWETMHWSTDPRETAGWLRCFLLQLKNEADITDDLRVRSWNTDIPSSFEDLSPAPPLSEKDRSEGPLVRLPEEASAWLPPIRRQAEAAGRRRKSLVVTLAGIALIILGALVLAGGLYWKGCREIRDLDARIAVAEREAVPYREAAEQWRRIEAAVDHRHFPVEILHHLVAAMPASGVRLTVFESSPENILVEGEAQNVSAATEFFANVRGSEGLQTLSWEMPPPSLQANNTARFVINGVRADAE
jgi:hypothetical protein